MPSNDKESNPKETNSSLSSTNTSHRQQSHHKYDSEAANTWIYPDNMEVRLYQQNIARAALLRNTLVCLPTGLGKTFIAAVVMYNYYRWFPTGKLIFTAPTRPLVRQQIDACYNAMGIPSHHLCQMTGKQSPSSRQSLWREHRVFFATPSVVANDLASSTCPATDVVLVVVDEAHQASGNHAVCQMIQHLSQIHQAFRVIGLSATPGSRLPAVQEVITNLRIGHVEVREEQDLDVREYTHSKSIKVDILPISNDMQQIHNNFLPIVKPILTRLCNAKVYFESDPALITQGRLVSALQRFRISPPRSLPTWKISSIAGDFGALIALAHAWELLNMYGYRPFLQRLLQIREEGAKDRTTEEQDKSKKKKGGKGGKRKNTTRAKQEVLKHPGFDATIDLVHQYVNDTGVYHPKIRRLIDIVRNHFIVSDTKPSGNKKVGNYKNNAKERDNDSRKEQDNDESESNGRIRTGTRIIIFTEYRDSVEDIRQSVDTIPGVRAEAFVGQGSGSSGRHRGLRQTEQGEVLRRFRGGLINTLVSTSIGEEGLDIGEVDLVVCFDARASPTRMVQRMGRTGRQRKGQVIVLVTEGAEERVYRSRKENKSSVYSVLRSASCSSSSSSSKRRTGGLVLFPDSPRMLPSHINPRMERRTLVRPASPPPGRRSPSNGNIRPQRRKRRDIAEERRYVDAVLGKESSRITNAREQEKGLQGRNEENNIWDKLERRWIQMEEGQGRGMLGMVHHVHHSSRTQLLVRCVNNVQCGMFNNSMNSLDDDTNAINPTTTPDQRISNINTKQPLITIDDASNGIVEQEGTTNKENDCRYESSSEHSSDNHEGAVPGELDMAEHLNYVEETHPSSFFSSSLTSFLPQSKCNNEDINVQHDDPDRNTLPDTLNVDSKLLDRNQQEECMSEASSASSSCSIPPPPVSAKTSSYEDNEEIKKNSLEESVDETDEDEIRNKSENEEDNGSDVNDGISADNPSSNDSNSNNFNSCSSLQLCFFCSAQFNSANALDRHLREYHHFGLDLSDDDSDDNYYNNVNNSNTDTKIKENNNNNTNNNNKLCLVQETTNNLNKRKTKTETNKENTLTASLSDDSISSSSTSSESEAEETPKNILLSCSTTIHGRDPIRPQIARRIREQRRQRVTRRQPSRRVYHTLPTTPSVVEDSEAEKEGYDTDPFAPRRRGSHRQTQHKQRNDGIPVQEPAAVLVAESSDGREDRRHSSTRHRPHNPTSFANLSSRQTQHETQQVEYKLKGKSSYDVGFLY